MIRGRVNNRRAAIVSLHVRGPNEERVIETLLDTGFSASLTLPVTITERMGLVRQSGGQTLLADGSTRQFDIFEAEVLWGMTWKPVLISAIGDESLLGMRLMTGHRILIDAVPGGTVEISPIE